MPKSSIDTVLEVQLKHDVSRGIVTGARVVETAEGFQLIFVINNCEYYLVSRREPETPRLFKDFERLVATLRKIYPDGTDNLRVEHKASFVSKRLASKSSTLSTTKNGSS